VESWKAARYGTSFRGHYCSTNISLDRDSPRKRTTELRSDHSRVEAGSNTSTAALQVIGDDEKREPSAGGYNWVTLILGDINTGTWPSRLGGLKTETVKYGHESRETRT
jgi:hypothetical protein